MLVMTFSSKAHADISDFTFRLAKAPDSKDSNKPATLAIQRSDGGQSDYITQGAVKGNNDFGPDNSSTFSPNLSWNHNSLASMPTDNWNLGANLLHKYVYSDRLERIDFDLSIKWMRDITKSSNSTPVKLDVTWYTKYLESKPWDPLSNYTLRPTLSVFWQDVYSAAVNKTTNVAPTGILSGEVLHFDFEIRRNRWSVTASTQDEHVTSTVSGQASGVYRLHSMALNYDFFDMPLTKDQQKASNWNPGITLMRQVGDDPFIAIAPSGFTQIALTLKY